MNKLFEIEAIKRPVTFRMETYKSNRVALKIVRILSKGNYFQVKEIEKDNKESRIFELYRVTNITFEQALSEVKNEIVASIPDNFKPNYLFCFYGHPLGFVNSFSITGEAGTINVSHKIKEIKPNTHLPKQIQL